MIANKLYIDDYNEYKEQQIKEQYMLTRLKVSGFKNLVDVDVHFGPFTCIAGQNSVGKSNLFDAIMFLSRLASDNLLNAASTIRSEGSRTTDIRSIFHRVGDTYDNRMSLEAEMIISNDGIDDLGQKAEATITFVRYKLTLGYKENLDLPTIGTLELISEDLEHINITSAPKLLRFPHSPEWRRSVIKGRRGTPFINTLNEGENVVIKLSQDGKQGRPRTLLAKNLPRTVLSTVNAIESPTALLVKREMQSWRLLQLEPSSLREPDNFTTPPGLLPNGAHLAATLYYLAHIQKDNSSTWIYDQVANRLSELIDDVRLVNVDRDTKRELLTVQIVDHDGTTYPARSLSDGTLRFLALATLDFDSTAGGVICMEEPENGIHPARIPAIIRLLQDIACDVHQPISKDNPLRQVIINTHSPAVVSQVPDDSLVMVMIFKKFSNGIPFRIASFGWLTNTWRDNLNEDQSPINKGELLAYLNPNLTIDDNTEYSYTKQRKNRVIDREDLHQMTLFPHE